MKGGFFRRFEEERPSPRLRYLATPGRILVSLFLVGVLAGLVAAQVNLWLSYARADGHPGLTRSDLVVHFHGRRDWSRLASKIDGGSMEKHVPIPTEKETLLAWARGGAKRADFEPAREVLTARCVRCHAPGGEKAESPFAEAADAAARFDRVEVYARPDTGVSANALARSTHAHLFGMSAMIGLVGLIYCFTDSRRRVKAVVIALPWIGMFLDVGSWWLARLHPWFVNTIVLGGALLALGVTVQCLQSLWETLGPKPKGLRV